MKLRNARSREAPRFIDLTRETATATGAVAREAPSYLEDYWVGLTTPEKRNPGTWPGLILQKGRGDQPKSHPVFACMMARGDPVSPSEPTMAGCAGAMEQRRDDVGCVNMRGTLQACGVCVNI